MPACVELDDDGVLHATVYDWRKQVVHKLVDVAQQLLWSNDFSPEHVRAYAAAMANEFQQFVTQQLDDCVQKLARKAEVEALLAEYGFGHRPDGIVMVRMRAYRRHNALVELELDTRASVIGPPHPNATLDDSLAAIPEIVAFVESDETECFVRGRELRSWWFVESGLDAEEEEDGSWRITKRPPIEVVAVDHDGRRYALDNGALKTVPRWSPFTVRDRGVPAELIVPEELPVDARDWSAATLNCDLSLRWPLRLNNSVTGPASLEHALSMVNDGVGVPAQVLHFVARRRALLDLLQRLGCPQHRIPLTTSYGVAFAFLSASGGPAARALSQRLVGDVRGALATGDIFFSLPPELIIHISRLLDSNSRVAAVKASRLFGIAAAAGDIL